MQAHAPREANSSVHGFKNFARIAHHATTLDGLELPDSKALFAMGREVKPRADVSCLFGKAAVSMDVYPLWKFVKLGNLGEILHQVPNSVLGNDPLSHAVRPPALLVELWKLNLLGKPHGQVIVKGTTLLKLCDPDVTKRNVTSLAPRANRLQTPRYVARLPADPGPISEGAEPDVLPSSCGAAKLVEMPTGPHDPSQSVDPSFLDGCVSEVDVQKRGVTCFI